MTALDLHGSTVVVTGASRGFGRATAIALAESGAQVVGVARHRGGLEELQRELGDALTCETGDVADPELPARLVGAYAERAGITEEEFIERAGATATPDQVARHVVDVIADGSYSAPAYHLTSDELRPLG